MNKSSLSNSSWVCSSVIELYLLFSDGRVMRLSGNGQVRCKCQRSPIAVVSQLDIGHDGVNWHMVSVTACHISTPETLQRAMRSSYKTCRSNAFIHVNNGNVICSLPSGCLCDRVCGIESGWLLERLSITRVSWRICPFAVSRYEGNYGDLPEKNYPSRLAFQGHSRSLEPTQIDRLPMTSY